MNDKGFVIDLIERITNRKSLRLSLQAPPVPSECPLPEQVTVSASALSTAWAIRGERHKPVIMLHGVAPRSGTVYTGQLLELHPEICASPRGLYEVPFLNLAERIRRTQQQFLSTYPQNEDKIGRDDFLPLFGASFIAYLNAAVPDGQRAFLKNPDVCGLDCFPYLFPFEVPFLLLRDGRDVVESTVRTWPERRFTDTCRLWNNNARFMLEQQRTHAELGWRIFYYEDASARPKEFVKQICQHFQLDASRYPYDRIDEIGVWGSSVVRKDGQVAWEGLPKPSDFNPIGRWRNWTPSQKEIFKQICGRTLIDSGYVQNNDW